MCRYGQCACDLIFASVDRARSAVSEFYLLWVPNSNRICDSAASHWTSSGCTTRIGSAMWWPLFGRFLTSLHMASAGSGPIVQPQSLAIPRRAAAVLFYRQDVMGTSRTFLGLWRSRAAAGYLDGFYRHGEGSTRPCRRDADYPVDGVEECMPDGCGGLSRGAGPAWRLYGDGARQCYLGGRDDLSGCGSQSPNRMSNAIAMCFSHSLVRAFHF